MEVIRYSSDPLNTVKYIKENLGFIEDVTDFEVYSHDEDIPDVYRNVPDVYFINRRREEQPKTYKFILRNRKQEVWLSGPTCGYGGIETEATIEILKLLGVKYDYEKIPREKKIVERNVLVRHDLNLLVCRRENWDSPREKLFKVKMSFKSAERKFKAKSALRQIGDFETLDVLIKSRIFDEVDAYYFRDLDYSTEQETEPYATNTVFIANQLYSKVPTDLIHEIIEDICKRYAAKYEFKFN